MKDLRIGTSGWSYQSWKGPFYPTDVPASRWLPEYAQTFNTVEVNNSFYRLPTAKAVQGWHDATPGDFVFAVKLSRYITHNKKLKADGHSFDKFFDVIDGLKQKCGPILVQLPPRFNVNVERLDTFLANAPKKYRYTLEFREKSWLCDEVYAVLKSHNAALCFFDINDWQPPEVLTANFVYLRLHGPGQAYAHSYTAAALKTYAEKIKDWRRHHDIFCYFDNDQKSHAPGNARTLLSYF